MSIIFKKNNSMAYFIIMQNDILRIIALPVHDVAKNFVKV